ncbi:MAG: NAD(P)-dependent glycerol-3-phosphate dehydrogenase [Acidobacteriaceae bacterium]|nr:NAD(P)-dependent glycerol-3-phosphate dehydrogenase [Acidobacteriaceae bacterium]
MSRVAILGAGAWGTALALSLARRGGHSLCMWSFDPELTRQIDDARENVPFLPGFPLPEGLTVTSDLACAVTGADILLFTTPSQFLRETVAKVAPLLAREQILLSASKGIEETTFLRMSEVIASFTANPCAVLSGPTFAQEVAQGAPTAVVAASTDPGVARTIQREFSSSSLRLYTNDDVIGVELGGALKNVIALAAGVVNGLELGHNTAAALITRGIAEITRLAVACGGRPQTLAGLSGIGDLVLTCTGSLSRNRSVGTELGRGRQLPEILSGMGGKVAEGVRSTAAALGLAERYGVEMPITSQMDAILHRGKRPGKAILELMSRPGRDESLN